jgi:hypothetical protein
VLYHMTGPSIATRMSASESKRTGVFSSPRAERGVQTPRRCGRFRAL